MNVNFPHNMLTRGFELVEFRLFYCFAINSTN